MIYYIHGTHRIIEEGIAIKYSPFNINKIKYDTV